MRRRHIFPAGLPASIFCAKKLNFCVRDGNRWILLAIITAMVMYSVFRRDIYYVVLCRTLTTAFRILLYKTTLCCIRKLSR